MLKARSTIAPVSADPTLPVRGHHTSPIRLVQGAWLPLSKALAVPLEHAAATRRQVVAMERGTHTSEVYNSAHVLRSYIRTSGMNRSIDKLIRVVLPGSDCEVL